MKTLLFLIDEIHLFKVDFVVSTELELQKL